MQIWGAKCFTDTRLQLQKLDRESSCRDPGVAPQLQELEANVEAFLAAHYMKVLCPVVGGGLGACEADSS